MLFESDRTCCVCRKAGPVQIHHIDEYPTNHDPQNLAVLCFDCHEETQRKGGFARGLDRAQVLLYRDNWLQTVAASRSTSELDIETPVSGRNTFDAQLVTSLVEINRAVGNWVGLAFLYHAIGNVELRDEVVEQAVESDPSGSTLVRLRRLQGRIDEVPEKEIEAELDRAQGDYRMVSRLLQDLGRYREATDTLLRGLAARSDVSDFHVAFTLKRLLDSDLIEGLFVRALQEAADADDLWWQVRALQELGWTSELHALVLSHEKEIEADDDLWPSQKATLRVIAARARGDGDAAREAIKDEERIMARAQVEHKEG